MDPSSPVNRGNFLGDSESKGSSKIGKMGDRQVVVFEGKQREISSEATKVFGVACVMIHKNADSPLIKQLDAEETKIAQKGQRDLNAEKNTLQVMTESLVKESKNIDSIDKWPGFVRATTGVLKQVKVFTEQNMEVRETREKKSWGITNFARSVIRGGKEKIKPTRSQVIKKNAEILKGKMQDIADIVLDRIENAHTILKIAEDFPDQVTTKMVDLARKNAKEAIPIFNALPVEMQYSDITQTAKECETYMEST